MPIGATTMRFRRVRPRICRGEKSLGLEREAFPALLVREFDAIEFRGLDVRVLRSLYLV